jgi:hypothetical protein
MTAVASTMLVVVTLGAVPVMMPALEEVVVMIPAACEYSPR